MKWESIENYHILSINERVLITDGKDWCIAYAIGGNGFVTNLKDHKAWYQGITHFARVLLPDDEKNGN